VRHRLAAGALALTTPLALAAPTDAGVVKRKRLHVRVGRTVLAVGGGAPAAVARLQVRRHGALRTIDRDRLSASGRYVLRDRMRRPMSARARVLVDGGAQAIVGGREFDLTEATARRLHFHGHSAVLSTR
jgi:peptidoglycan lytic transglycosylase